MIVLLFHNVADRIHNVYHTHHEALQYVPARQARFRDRRTRHHHSRRLGLRADDRRGGHRSYRRGRLGGEDHARPQALRGRLPCDAGQHGAQGGGGRHDRRHRHAGPSRRDRCGPGLRRGPRVVRRRCPGGRSDGPARSRRDECRGLRGAGRSGEGLCLLRGGGGGPRRRPCRRLARSGRHSPRPAAAGPRRSRVPNHPRRDHADDGHRDEGPTTQALDADRPGASPPTTTTPGTAAVVARP